MNIIMLCIHGNLIEIRSWWEVPCIAHFCHIFSKPFKLPDFEIEVSEFENSA